MKLKFIYLFLCAAMLQSTALLAQRASDLTFTFKQDIESILLNPYTGSVIVKEKDAIESYNPQTNATEWTVNESEIAKTGSAAGAALGVASDILSAGTDLGKFLGSQKEVPSFIPNSPFLSATVNNSDIIIHAVTGKIVFNSATLGFRTVQSQFMPAQNALLLMVVDSENYCAVYYDLASSSVKWKTKLSTLDGFSKAMGAVLSFMNKGDGGEEKSKVETTQSDIYACVYGELYKMNKADGSVNWKTDFKITDFFLSQNKKNIVTIRSTGSIFSKKEAVNILATADGNKMWKDDIKADYITYLEDWSDRLLIARSNGFNFYSYADGQKIWKKDAKGDKIKQVIALGADYLYVADKEVNLIDKDGKNKWKNFIEICDNNEDAVFYLDKIDENRVMYLTDTYGNMIDYTTGKKIWKKNIKFDKDKPLIYSYDQTQNAYFVFNNKKIYKFDPKANDGRDEFAKLKDVKEDKSIENIELFPWGISLVGQSDVIGVTFDGEVKYHNTYKEPGGGTRKFLSTSTKIGKGVLDTYSAVNQSLSNATITMEYRNDKGEIVSQTSNLFSDESRADMQKNSDISSGASSLLGAGVLSKVQDRFNALKHANGYAFVLAKNETTGKPQLVKVRKEDGKEIDIIAIEGNKPLYEVDPVNDNMYYVHKNELRIYNNK